MTDAEALQINVESFSWDSEVQKEGFLNYVQYLRDRGAQVPTNVPLLAAYFIQKDHESNEYWRELVGEQISSIQRELYETKATVESLRLQVELIATVTKTQAQLIDQLIRAADHLRPEKASAAVAPA